MQRVLITGGKGDLAKHLAAGFSKNGDHVECPGRDRLDVASPDSVRDYFGDAGPFDLVVIHAGVRDDALLARTSPGSWDLQMQVNLHGAIRCASHALPGMLAAGRGHFIFISSHSAIHPPAGQSAYATGKAALLGLAGALASDHGASDIRSNVILPGFLATRMTAGLPESRRAAVLREHRLGRLNTPESAAAFAVHLHHHLPHTSGQIFQLDSRQA